MWSFLDRVDKNLLYNYTQVLSGKKRRIYSADMEKTEESKYKHAEKAKYQILYLVWFVYRYVLECDTLEKALEYANEETLKKYRLYTSMLHGAVYFGIYNDISCRKAEDIVIVLEILYNRYDFFEQIECYIRHTQNLRQARAKEALKCYKDAAEQLV